MSTFMAFFYLAHQIHQPIPKLQNLSFHKKFYESHCFLTKSIANEETRIEKRAYLLLRPKRSHQIFSRILNLRIYESMIIFCFTAL